VKGKLHKPGKERLSTIGSETKEAHLVPRTGGNKGGGLFVGIRTKGINPTQPDR